VFWVFKLPEHNFWGGGYKLPMHNLTNSFLLLTENFQPEKSITQKKWAKREGTVKCYTKSPSFSVPSAKLCSSTEKCSLSWTAYICFQQPTEWQNVTCFLLFLVIKSSCIASWYFGINDMLQKYYLFSCVLRNIFLDFCRCSFVSEDGVNG
jgi:hypothetical protein